MRSLSTGDQRALKALPNATARMIVQRWLELTDPQTHPEWRLDPHGAPASGTVQLLLRDHEQGRTDRAYHTTRAFFSELLAAGGNPAWQQATARSFLLDNRGQHAAAGRDFPARLSQLDPAREGGGRGGDRRPWVIWRTEPPISNSQRLAWRDGFRLPLPSDAEPGDDEIALGGARDGANRHLTLFARAPLDGPRAVQRVATRLREEGSVLLDAIRLSVPGRPLHVPPSFQVDGSTLVNSVKAPPMPRMQPDRVRRAIATTVVLYDADRTTPSARRALSSIRWLSAAFARWHESPAFAAALLWMALEAQYGKCVWKHPDDCTEPDQAGHRSAIELYLETLPNRLGDEIETYLREVRGRPVERRRGRRSPPNWMGTVPLARGKTALRPWLRRLMAAMERDGDDDPLLRHHCAEVLKMRGAPGDLERRRVSDLRALYKARNAVVHEGNVVLQEEQSLYLASLACEMLLLGLERQAVD